LRIISRGLGLSGHEQREQRDNDHYWYHCLVFAGAGQSHGGERLFPVASLNATQRGFVAGISGSADVVSVCEGEKRCTFPLSASFARQKFPLAIPGSLRISISTRAFADRGLAGWPLGYDT
jgi:hypothetical protein